MIIQNLVEKAFLLEKTQPFLVKTSGSDCCSQMLQEELCSRQQQVSSLQEISSQLLLEAAGEDSVEAKEKVHVICNKLRLLLRQVAADLHVLQGRLVRPCFLCRLFDSDVILIRPMRGCKLLMCHFFSIGANLI